MDAAPPSWTLWELQGWEGDYVTGASEASSYLVAALHEATGYITGRAAVRATAPRHGNPAHPRRCAVDGRSSGSRDTGDPRAQQTALIALGDTMLQLGRTPTAIDHYDEAVTLGG